MGSPLRYNELDTWNCAILEYRFLPALLLLLLEEQQVTWKRRNCGQICLKLSKNMRYTQFLHKTVATKELFTDRCRWQNFHPSLLRLVDTLYIVIHKTQKTRTKVLTSAMVGEQHFSTIHPLCSCFTILDDVLQILSTVSS